MTDAWISAAPALAQVVAIELNPKVAQTKLIEAIKRGTMPAKVVSDRGERFLSADMFHGRHGWIKIDFDTGSGRYVEDSFVAGEPPYSEWEFRDLVISRRHLDEAWPASNPKVAVLPVTGVRAGGSPGKWDWEGAYIEMARIVALEDVSPTRPTLNELVLNWFMTTAGDHPSESQIRDKVKRFHEAIWPPRA